MPEIGDTLPAPTPTPPAPAPAAAAPAPEPKPTEEKTFTQADLDKYAARARSEGKKSATNEVAEALGIPVEDAKKIIAAHQEAEAAAKTEAERARDEAAAAKAEADKAKADAAQELFKAKLERKLTRAGVGAGLTDSEEDEKKRQSLMARAVRLVDLEADADDEAIATEIEQLKADVPGLFTSASAAPASAPSGVTPSKPPSGGQSSVSPLDKGRSRYRSGRPDPEKKTDPFAGSAIRRVG